MHPRAAQTLEAEKARLEAELAAVKAAHEEEKRRTAKEAEMQAGRPRRPAPPPPPPLVLTGHAASLTPY